MHRIRSFLTRLGPTRLRCISLFWMMTTAAPVPSTLADRRTRGLLGILPCLRIQLRLITRLLLRLSLSTPLLLCPLVPPLQFHRIAPPPLRTPLVRSRGWRCRFLSSIQRRPCSRHSVRRSTLSPQHLPLLPWRVALKAYLRPTTRVKFSLTTPPRASFSLCGSTGTTTRTMALLPPLHLRLANLPPVLTV